MTPGSLLKKSVWRPLRALGYGFRRTAPTTSRAAVIVPTWLDPSRTRCSPRDGADSSACIFRHGPFISPKPGLSGEHEERQVPEVPHGAYLLPRRLPRAGDLLEDGPGAWAWRRWPASGALLGSPRKSLPLAAKRPVRSRARATPVVGRGPKGGMRSCRARHLRCLRLAERLRIKGG